MKKKFIELSEVEKITLLEGEKNGKAATFRQRCQCLRLSSEGYQVKALAQVFESPRFAFTVGSSDGDRRHRRIKR